MKKTLIALMALAGVAAAATEVIYWGGNGGYDLLTVNDGGTPYLTTDKTSWGSADIVTKMTTVGNTEYSLIFNPSENKEGQPAQPVTNPYFTLNDDIYLKNLNIAGQSSLQSIEIDFGTSGSITSELEINFGMNLDITLMATLTADQLSSLSEEGFVITRTLLYAGGNYGVWNFDKAKSVTLEVAGLSGYEYVGKIASADALKIGQFGYISTTVNGTDAPGAVQLVVKAVPEPTTATLSLLALAGLAVRRRRK